MEVLENDFCQFLLTKDNEIKQCLSNDTLLQVIQNPFIDSMKKVSILEEVLEIHNDCLSQLLWILADSNQLDLLLRILDNMYQSLILSNGFCRTSLYTPQELDSTLVENLQKILEDKLGYKLLIHQKIWNQEGIKCVIDDLSLEISISKERLLQELTKFILFSFTKGVQIEN